MTLVVVGIGSNIEPAQHVKSAIAALHKQFGELRVSPVYRSRAVGFEGDDFYNLVIAFDSSEDVHVIDEMLTAIERAHGRTPGGPKFAARTLDLDLLLYGDAILDEPDLRLPRKEILDYAFVLQPLADLLGDLPHPATGKTFAEHWQTFANNEPPLQRVTVSF